MTETFAESIGHATHAAIVHGADAGWEVLCGELEIDGVALELALAEQFSQFDLYRELTDQQVEILTLARTAFAVGARWQRERDQ